MTAVTHITHVAHIDPPRALRDLPAWLVWRYEPNDNPEGKPRKIPYYAGGSRRQGEQGRPEDRAQLVTFDAARTAAARRGMDGVGFAPMPEFNVVALDFDNCVADGAIHPDVLSVLATTYAEYSPSGNGIRAFFRGQLGNLKTHGEPFGFELFSSKGYVTFTGNMLDLCEVMGNADEVAPIDASVQALIRKRFSRELERNAQPFESSAEPLGMTVAQIEAALDVLPKDLDYDTWVLVGMAIHHETRGEGFEIWETWSQSSPKYTSREYNLERWRSFGHNGGRIVTARSLIKLANEYGAGINLSGPASLEDFEAITSTQPVRFQPVPLAEFASRPAPQWIVKGVIPKAELVVLFGESGSGKSFVALDIGAAIARGIPWRGHRVKRGRVVYIAAEGAGGFRNRCVAYARQHELAYPDIPIDIIADAPNLLQREDALAVARAIGEADLVVVDTFAQVTPGGNENAGEDMGRALAHCKGIHRATGATVVLVHHSGKDASKGARGWSGLRAAADAELEVSKTPAGRLLRTTKQKDGDDEREWGFALDVVEIGVDEDGDPITSCIVVEAVAPVAALRKPLGAKAQIVNAVIQEFAVAQTSGIEVDAVIREAASRMAKPEEGKRDTRRQHAKRALETLCEGDDAPYWLRDDGTIDVL